VQCARRGVYVDTQGRGRMSSSLCLVFLLNKGENFNNLYDCHSHIKHTRNKHYVPHC
jgi:hypothetical protein